MKKWNRFIQLRFIAIILLLLILPLITYAQKIDWSSYVKYYPENSPVVKRHLRGVWITTVLNLDWPKADTVKLKNDEERIKKSKQELIEILDKVIEMNMNAVFFQVSPEGDAFYKSNVVPWSRYLTGTFGKDPGFDPLAFAIDEAHKRNIEFHVWFNPYRISMNTNDNTKQSLNIQKSVYKEKPHLIKTSYNRFVVDPGIPESRKWVEDRVMEVVNKYDIDGVHFDDYFYYEKNIGEMNDQHTYEKYNNNQFTNKDDWRRNNTYLLIKDLSIKIRQTKPWVKFGISPAGIWGSTKDGLQDGINTTSSYTNYNRCFADTRKWVIDEIIDYIAPQVYYSFSNSAAPYGELAAWWSDVVKNKNVHLYIGQALYKVNNDADQSFKGYKALHEFGKQLLFNVVKPEISGSIMFRYNNIVEQGKRNVIYAMQSDIWSKKALVPIMPWKKGVIPNNPINGSIENSEDGIKLTWTNDDSNTAYFAVYRFHLFDTGDVHSDLSGNNLIATVRKSNSGQHQFIDNEMTSSTNYFYVVTAVDTLHNESNGLNIGDSISRYFSDVSREYHWAVESIDKMYEKEIVNGIGSGLFNPGHKTKRADFILLIVRAFSLKADFNDNFNDVSADSYYYNAVGIAKSLGIILGKGNSFHPDEYITREDMTVVIFRAIKSIGLSVENSDFGQLNIYGDEKNISNYARESMAALVQKGIVKGSGGNLKPKQVATRAECTVIINRVLNYTLLT